MSATIEELTFDYRNEDGVLVRREVDRAVLSKGAWATIMFLYQDLDKAAGRYRAPKVAIVRYRKTNGVYRKQSSFNISSERQGRMIMEVLERWYGMTEADLPPVEVDATKPGEASSETPAEASSVAAPIGEAMAGEGTDRETTSAPLDAPVATSGQNAPSVEETPRPMDETTSPFGGTNS